MKNIIKSQSSTANKYALITAEFQLSQSKYYQDAPPAAQYLHTGQSYCKKPRVQNLRRRKNKTEKAWEKLSINLCHSSGGPE